MDVNAVKEEVKSTLGINLLNEWINKAVDLSMQNERDNASVVKMLCSSFLESDIKLSGAGCLPLNIKDLHKVVLRGLYILQIEEIVDIANSIKERYKENCRNRCLKLHLTDGKQHVFAIEYKKIPCLSINLAAGTKVAVSDLKVRRGLLLLAPENVTILGGKVNYMEEARQKCLKVWAAKPTGENVKLAEAMSLAAWDNGEIASPAAESRAVNALGNTVAVNAFTDITCLGDHRGRIGEKIMSMRPSPASHMMMASHEVSSFQNPVLMSLSDFQLRSKATNKATFPLKATVIAKIKKGGILTVKGTVEALQFSMELVIGDAEIQLSAVLDHSILQCQIGCGPEEFVSDLKRGNKTRQNTIVSFLSGFQGTMQLTCDTPGQIPVITAMKRN